MDRLLPFRHMKILHPLQKAEGSLPLDRICTGALDFSVLDLILLEKLSSASTTGSARAVVAPLE